MKGFFSFAHVKYIILCLIAWVVLHFFHLPCLGCVSRSSVCGEAVWAHLQQSMDMAASLGKEGLCITGWGDLVGGFYSLMIQRHHRCDLGAFTGRAAGLGYLEQWKLVPRLA